MSNKTAPENRLHVVYAGFVLGLSFCMYLLLFAQLITHSSDGGGQPTLPGMGKIVTALMSIIMLVALGIQLILFWFIRKKRRMPFAGFLIALPFILVVPTTIAIMDETGDLPHGYLTIVLVSLAASALFFWLAIRSANKRAIYASILFAVAPWSFVLYCFL